MVQSEPALHAENRKGRYEKKATTLTRLRQIPEVDATRENLQFQLDRLRGEIFLTCIVEI
jgi:hypothetical protein